MEKSEGEEEEQLFEFRVILNNWIETPILITFDRTIARNRANEFKKIHGDKKVIIRIELKESYLISRRKNYRKATMSYGELQVYKK